MADRVVRIVIAGDAAGGVRALKTTSAAAKETTVALDRTSASSSKFASTIASLGKKAVLGGLAAVGIAGFEGVKGIVALQKQMEMLHTQAGASQAEVAAQTKNVLGISGSLGTGPQQLAEALYHVESVGFRAAQALSVLKVAAQGAKVGGADLTDVTNALSASVVSGIRGVQNYQQAMGALNAIVGAGDMKMQDLADALGTGLLAKMKLAGLSIAQVGGALATFGDNNIRGTEAATQLASAIRIMANPSIAGAKYLALIGIQQSQLADDMRHGGIIQAMTDLKAHLEASGLTASQQSLVITRAFGGRQSGGVQILLTQLERLKQKTAEVGTGAGTFADDWAATQKTLAFQFDQIKAGLQSLADKLGQALIPELSDVLGWMLRNKRTMKDLGIAVVAATGLFLSFKTAMAAGRLAMAAVAFATGGWTASFWALNAAMAANPIGLIIVGLAALTAGIIYTYDKWAWFRKAVNDLGPVFRVILEPAILFINSILEGIRLAIAAVNKLGEASNSLPFHPFGTFHDIQQPGLLGGNLYGGNILWPSAGGSSGNSSQNALTASTAPAPGWVQAVEVHTHVHLDSRQIAESVARHNLQQAARR